MNRTLYYRNLAIFLVFVAVLFATPYLFADATSPTLLRIDNANLNLYHRTYSNNVNTSLGKGSVIRLPDPIIQNVVFDANGDIAMAATLKVWHTLAARDKRLLPKQVGGKLVYPVKIMAASDEGFNINSRNAVGYVPLTDLLRPGTFNTVRFDQGKILEQEQATATPPRDPETPITKEKPSSANQVFFYDPDNEYQIGLPEEETRETVTVEDEVSLPDEGFSETTAPDSSLRPVARPERPTSPQQSPAADSYAPSRDTEFTCNHRDYSKSFRTSGCFTQAGMTMVDKAKHLLGDLEAINQLRSAANGKANQPRVDPRFSLCITYHETGGYMEPNTSSGRGDYGLFQIRKSTGAGALANFGMITPGFEHFDQKSEYHRVNGDPYKGLHHKMAGSPIAQSDLHHSIVVMKAGEIDARSQPRSPCKNNIMYRLGMDRATADDYQCLANYYNASPTRTSYARKIRTCYDRLKNNNIVDNSGTVINENRLKWALDGALGK